MLYHFQPRSSTKRFSNILQEQTAILSLYAILSSKGVKGRPDKLFPAIRQGWFFGQSITHNLQFQYPAGKRAQSKSPHRKSKRSFFFFYLPGEVRSLRDLVRTPPTPGPRLRSCRLTFFFKLPARNSFCRSSPVSERRDFPSNLRPFAKPGPRPESHFHSPRSSPK